MKLSLQITCYASYGIPDADELAWYLDGHQLDEGQLGNLTVGPYEDDYGSHEVRQTLTWTVGDEEETYQISCVAREAQLQIV